MIPSRLLVLALLFTWATWGLSPALAEGPLETLPLRGLKASVAHLLFSSEEGGVLPLAVLAVPRQGTAEGVTEVALVVEIDGQSLLEHLQPPVLALEIYAYAVTSQGTVAAHCAESLTLDAATEHEAGSTVGEALAASGLKFQGRLDVPTGDYQLRVLVRHPPSGAHGLRVLSLHIPSLVPIFPEPPQRWLQTMASNGSGGFSHTPAARPVLGAGRQASALLPMQSTAVERWRGHFQLTSSDDKTAEITSDLEVLETTANGLPVRFRVPRVPPGEYLLQLELSGSGDRQIQSVAVPVLVVSENTPEQTLLWTDLRWQEPPPKALLPPLPASSPTSSTAAPTEPSRSSAPAKATRRLQELAAPYRSTLRLLADGDLAAARSALLDVESAALGRGRDPLGQLRKAEESVHLELVAVDAEALLPVVTLHLDLYHAYVRRKLHSLVSHSRATVQQLVRLYADRGGDQDLAADALSGLAFDLYTSGLLNLGLGLSKDALAFSGAHRESLLNLAIGLEKGGDYRGAATVLERLTTTHPSFAEGRLRLAVNLERTGQSKGAELLLTQLVEERVAGWIGALANERLARRLLATGRAAEASDLLTTATANHPTVAGLQLLRAHLEDRRHQSQAAFLILRNLTPQPESPSPVWRYDSWPHALFEEIHSTLEAAAADRCGALRRALEP